MGVYPSLGPQIGTNLPFTGLLSRMMGTVEQPSLIHQPGHLPVYHRNETQGGQCTRVWGSQLLLDAEQSS